MHTLYTIDSLEDLYNIEELIQYSVKNYEKNAHPTYEDNKKAFVLAIEKGHFNSYYNLYEKIKEEDIYIIKNNYKEKINEIINKYIDIELEKEYKFPVSEKKFAFLLQEGADAEYLLKYSIEKKEDIKLFKCLIGYCELENVLKKFNQTNYKQTIDIFLNKQLEKFYNEKNLNNKIINFLLDIGAQKEKALEIAISDREIHVISFIRFIKENRLILMTLEKNNEIVSLISKTIEIWLKELMNIKMNINKIEQNLSRGISKVTTPILVKSIIDEEDSDEEELYKDEEDSDEEELYKDEENSWEENSYQILEVFSHYNYNEIEKKIDLENRKKIIIKNLNNKYNIEFEDIENNISFLIGIKKRIDYILENGIKKENFYFEIERLIGEKKFNEFYFFIKEFKEYGINMQCIKPKVQQYLNKLLEKHCCDQNKLAEDIQFILDLGANKEEALKISVDEKHLESFKYLIENENIKADLEIIREDKNINNKLQEQLDIWLEEKCIDKDIENINFLLDLGANKESALKISVEKGQKHFESFKYLIEKLQVTLETLKRDNEYKLQKQLDSWLEKVCMEHSNENINFLLEQYIDKEYALKISVEKDMFLIFKILINKYGLNINNIRNSDWNKEKILEKQIYDWLKNLDRIYSYEYNINILFILETIKEFKEDILKYSVKQNDFNIFKILIKQGTNLETLKRDNELNIDSELQKQLDNWLEEKCDEFDKNEQDIQVLLNLANKENALKIAIEKCHYVSFHRLLDTEIDLDVIIKDNSWNNNGKYTQRINLFKEKICGYTRYANRKGNSSVKAYEFGKDFIVVYFSYGNYVYTYASAGIENIENMKKLALKGEGLCSYIHRNVKYRYAKKNY